MQTGKQGKGSGGWPTQILGEDLRCKLGGVLDALRLMLELRAKVGMGARILIQNNDIIKSSFQQVGIDSDGASGGPF